MNRDVNTLDFPLRAAARGKHDHVSAQTDVFLFAGDEGRVVTRGSIETEDDNRILPGARNTTALSPDVNLQGSIPSSRPRQIPQAKVIRGFTAQPYILLKKYVGVVTGRDEESFTARLVENSSDYPVIEAEFELEELSESDRPLAIEGASLVWTIGYAYEGSTRKRESMIYLRRLPPWSAAEIEQGRKAAEVLTCGIRWE